MNDAIRLAKSVKPVARVRLSEGGELELRRAKMAKERAGGQELPSSKFMPNVPRQVHADGGDVTPDIQNPMSVFPKPQRMFPEDDRPAGGQYLSMPDKQDMTGHKSAAASIGIGSGGKPYFTASRDAVDETGTSGKGNAVAKTNLFKQKAGWRWQDAPEGHENTNTIVSVEHRGKHYYALNAHFPKGVDLARYENSPSEPRLRPTTRGNIDLGPQAGSILVRGKEHPVYHHVIVKADGGGVLGLAKSVKPVRRKKLAYGGHQDADTTQATGYFEVAPGKTWDPVQQASWEQLHPQAKQAISNKMVGEFLSPWQRISGINGEVRSGLGGFGGHTNPNYTFHPYDSSKINESLSQLGELFRQDAMMGAHSRPFEGSFPSGVIRVHMPKGVSTDDAHAVYKHLNGLGLADGHSTNTENGTMDILSGDGKKQTINSAKAIDKALGGRYDVSSYPTNISFPEHGENYGISGTQASESSRPPASKAHSDLQAKASARLQELLEDAHGQGGGHQGEVSFGDTLAQGQPHPDTLPALLPKTVRGNRDPQPIEEPRPDIAPTSHSQENLERISTQMWKDHPASGGEELSGPEAFNRITDFHTKNLLALWDATPQAQRQTSRFWYRAAHALGNAYAEDHNIMPRAAHGIMAVLSPQNPWDKNVTQAERLMDILHHHMDTPWTNGMSEVVQTGGSTGRGLPADKGTMETGPHNWSDIEGKTLRDVLSGAYGQAKAAMWIRAFDEAHNPTEYQAVGPTGEFLGTQMNKSGSAPDTSSWNSYNPIRKAISIWFDPSRENINQNIGDNHKVREFYNVITNPHDPNGVVIDTHAVAAGELLPHGSSAKAVHRNFGSTPGVVGKAYLERIGTPWVEGESPSRTTGSSGAKGDYPVHAEAVRRAAWARGVHPSEMQSVTWERVRQLFSDKGPEAQRRARAIWQRHANGELTHDQAINEIITQFGGENERSASWHGTQQGATGLGNVRTGSYVRPMNITSESPAVKRYNRQIEPTEDGEEFKNGGEVEPTFHEKLAKHQENYIPHDDPRRGESLAEFHKDAHPDLKNPDGSPKVFYHGTRALYQQSLRDYDSTPDFQEFDTKSSEMGSHFGPQEQGNDFTGSEPEQRGHMYPVHLNIKNPIRLEDHGSFSPRRAMGQLHKEIVEKSFKHLENFEPQEALQNALKEHGHDGIVYLNRREGLNDYGKRPNPEDLSYLGDDAFKKIYPEAQDSYIAFDPEQIKSASGNQGTFDPSKPKMNEARGGFIHPVRAISGFHIDTGKVGQPMFTGRL